MKVITIANQKGGTGKSTITANIACLFSNNNYNTLVIDTDFQNSISDFHLIRSKKENLKNFSCIKILNPTIHQEVSKFNNFDIIIIDTGGRYSKVFSSAILSSDIVIIPVLPSPYDIFATYDSIEIINEIQQYKQFQSYILLNMVMEKTLINKEIEENINELINKYNVKLLNSKLHNLIAYKYSINEGISVYERSNDKAGKEILELYQEILNILEL
jgi:chromosome partitioning protein